MFLRSIPVNLHSRILCLSISYDFCDAKVGGVSKAMLTLQNNMGDIFAQISGNIWTNSLDPTVPAVYIENLGGATTMCVELLNNISDRAPTAYTFDNVGAGMFNATTGSNVGTISTVGVIASTPCP